MKDQPMLMFLGLCVISMLAAATVSIFYKPDRCVPPRWVERWFFGSTLVGVWALVVYAVWCVVGAE